MKLKINSLGLFSSFVFLSIAYAIITEEADKYIKFASEDNALGCFLIAGTFGLLCLGASFSLKKEGDNE
jgi:hypothetical protein